MHVGPTTLFEWSGLLLFDLRRYGLDSRDFRYETGRRDYTFDPGKAEWRLVVGERGVGATGLAAQAGAWG